MCAAKTGGGVVPLALIQMACSPDPSENLAAASERIERAARDGARLICLPELFRSRYFCQSEDAAHFDLAEPVPGPTTEAFAALARELGVVCVLNVFERAADRDGDRTYDTSPIIDADGSLLGVVRMQHLAEEPGFHEQGYYTPGPAEPPRVFETAAGPYEPYFIFPPKDVSLPDSTTLLAPSRRATMLIVSPSEVRLEKQVVAKLQKGTVPPKYKRDAAARSLLIEPLHKAQQLAFAQYRIVDSQAGKLDLLWVIDAQPVQEPVVQGPVILEFQGAQGMGDALDGIALTVGPVIHGVNAPPVGRAVMLGVQDAIQDRIAQVKVARGHVDLGPQHPAAVGELARAHSLEQVQVLLDGPVAVWALFAGLG